MRPRSTLRWLLPKVTMAALAAALLLAAPGLLSRGAAADDTAAISNAEKAQSLVNAAINMTDSSEALKLLWQATDIDPTYEQAYVYLGLYYNSRADYPDVVKVYQKLVRYHPKLVSAYLNIGEAYMAFTPSAPDKALPYYRKAYQLDPTSGYAALRIGEILALQGNDGEAVKYLNQAANSDSSKNPSVPSEARDILHKLGAR